MFRAASRYAIQPATRLRALSTVARAKERWNGRVVFTEEVEHALEKGLPVVALESAIITHGMPYPTNMTTAQSVESIISTHAVPATIALHGGLIHVGLSPSLLAELSEPASSSSSSSASSAPRTKVSRRDIAPTLGLGWTGGTTVAATMVVAQSVGIDVFVTGGIGGVHRGAQESMDVSADLIELGRTPMAVVCAGAKSILDIPRTLEVLETQGVCVATLGSSTFPAFYSPSSGEPSPWSINSVDEAATVIHTGLTLPSPQATLLAVPIPAEHEIAGLRVQEAVEQAVRESVEQGIDRRGKEVTPWLLKRVGELTRGSALDLNVKLIENNASVGAQIAKRVAQLHASRSSYDLRWDRKQSGRQTQNSPRLTTSSPFSSAPSTLPKPLAEPEPVPSASRPDPSVLVFGSAAIDLTSTAPTVLSPRSTTPGSVYLSPGGVGRNIAEAAQRLLPPCSVLLVSPIGIDPSSSSSTSTEATPTALKTIATPNPGQVAATATDDAFGKVLRMEMAACGLRDDGLVPMPGSTAVCSLTLEMDRDLVVGVADMGIVETLDPSVVTTFITDHRPQLVVFDLNLSPTALSSLLEACAIHSIPTFCDPTSVPKLSRLIPSLQSPPSSRLHKSVSHISPNALELEHIYNALMVSRDNGDRGEGDWAWEYTASLGLDGTWRAAVEVWAARVDKAVGGEGVGKWVKETGVVTQMIACLPWCDSFWLKSGSKGLLHLSLNANSSTPSITTRSSSYALTDTTLRHQTPHGTLVLTHYPAPRIDPGEIVSTTGAGDTLVGGIVAGLVGGEGTAEAEFMAHAVEGVKRSLKSRRAVA